jgi:hypothetical protein
MSLIFLDFWLMGSIGSAMADEAEHIDENPISPSMVRFIKLGEGGRWEEKCLTEGLVMIRFPEITHELGKSRDRAKIHEAFLGQGLTQGTATNYSNQILDFFSPCDNILWITFARGHLWWAFTDREVIPMSAIEPDAEKGVRFRRTKGGWRNKSLGGFPLHIEDLSGRLTQMAGFRGTMCKVKESDYVIRKINDEDMPEIIEAKKTRSALLETIKTLIQLLTWQDFELLVDLVFAQSGWRRIGEVGGLQKTVDLQLELPSTGETAFVQVKSKTDQAQLDSYLDQLKARPHTRMFYVYHSAPASLQTSDPRCILVNADRLASMVLDAGLTNWIIKKAS